MEIANAEALTIEDVHDDRLEVGVGRVAGVLARVGRVGALDEQVRRRHVALLRDDAHTAPRRVVVDLLKK